MGDSTTPKFKVNPVEVIVFAGVALIFANSIYSLFYDVRVLRSVIATTAQDGSASHHSRSGRSLAGVQSPSKAFEEFHFDCLDEKNQYQMSPQKLRILGKICPSSAPFKNLDITIRPEGAQTAHTATVFPGGGQFETDYLPLAQGKNQLDLQFTYQDGKVVERRIWFIKN